MATLETTVAERHLRLRHKVVILWGLCLPFLAQVPALDMTLPGTILRYVVVAAAVILLVVNLSRILPALGLFEATVIGYFLLAAAISSAAGIWDGFSPDLATFTKFFMLNFFIYLVARSLDTERSVECFLRAYYVLALIAAIQGIATLAAEHWGVRQLGIVPIDDGGSESAPYALTWYGLLGGDVGNFRANFFFSESTHFAHFLFPAIGYALAKEKHIGLLILITGFASSFSVTAFVALVGLLILWSLRFARARTIVSLIVGVAVATAALAIYITQNETAFFLLIDRTQSVEDKLHTYQVAYQWLFEHPLGSGLIDTVNYFGLTVNTSGGLFNYAIWFGWLAWPAVLSIIGILLVTGVSARRDRLYSGMALSLFFLCMATISHGPLFKYYMIFFLGLCATYWSIRRGSKHVVTYAHQWKRADSLGSQTS